ncbi:type II toxin-antitoxin system RelE/ParE family toxin [Fibrobacter sp. UBA2449]|uniref:type II toxin-antitoxin system RelE/ParE family toxin n=1 Tax=Fibrobacter sp. UBA2449 TaxID=1946529 RepID=UPI0039C893F4
MNYRVEYLPLALSDLKSAIAHISNELGMPKAATELVERIVGDIDSLADFPYSQPAYTPIKPLKHDFRKMVVQNYSIGLTKTQNNNSCSNSVQPKKHHFINSITTSTQKQ